MATTNAPAEALADAGFDDELQRIQDAVFATPPWRRKYELRVLDAADVPHGGGLLLARAATWRGAVTGAQARTVCLRQAGWRHLRVVVTLRGGAGLYDPSPAWD